MANRRTAAEDEVRVNFRVALSVNPLLGSDLKRLTLRRSRHARLLTLATIGLQSEKKALSSGSPVLHEAGPTAASAATTKAPEARLSDHDFADIGE